ncbi:MAG: urease accessory protein UreD [Pseudomonadota bacterium]
MNAPQLLAAPPLERTWGEARCAFRLRGERHEIAELHQAGALKVRMPRTPVAAAAEAVLINTAGGLTDGDRLDVAVEVGAGAHAVVTTQAAERAYASRGGDATARTRLRVKAGGQLAWLPQETILFDRSRLRRSLEIGLEGDARLLAHESLVFGRAAMGERLASGRFRDLWRVCRDGRLLHAEAFRLEGDIAARLEGSALLAGAGAMTTILYIAEDTEEMAVTLRHQIERLPAMDGLLAVSAWGGKLVVRGVAESGYHLRRLVVPILCQLHGGALPRIWTT